MKKIALFIVTIMILTALLLSCGTDGNVSDGADTTTAPSTGETTTDPAVSAEDPSTDRVIFDGTVCEYTIMRSDYADSMIADASVDLRNAMSEMISDTAKNIVKIQTDFDKAAGRDGTVENDNKEILVGETNRKESKEAHAQLKENEYVIKWSGNKLLILGYDDYTTIQAVAVFIEKYLSTKQQTFSLAADINITGEASIQKISLAKDSELRIMTFNILGSGNGFNEGRKELIISTILDYLPDVIGFQESNKTDLNEVHLSKVISEYYNVNQKLHGGTSTANYTPILYLKSKYKQIEGGVEWNNSRYTRTNTKSLSWSVLERLSDGQRFIVINIHGSLWLDSYTLPEGETLESIKKKAGNEWKIDNANQVLAKISALQEKYGDIPAMTVGDYNFNKNHAAYKTMQSTGLSSAQDTARTATISHGSYHNSVGQMPAVGGLAIDHIFYSPDSIEAIKHVICMRPSDIKASDHCPVYCDIKFK